MNDTVRHHDESASLVDTHCHIDLYPSPADVLQRCEAERIYTVAVTNAPSVFSHTQSLCGGKRYVRAALGLHPELMRTHAHELNLMWPLLDQTRYVGEIGLDYTTTDESERRVQRDAFDQILSHCATYGNKVLTVHSRRAAADVLAAVGQRFAGTVILHWFSGTLKQADAAAASGFYFSVNTAMIRSAASQKLIARLPPERILTETDGPFVTTGGRPSHPADTALVVEYLSRLWRTSTEDTRAGVLSNFHDLLTPSA